MKTEHEKYLREIYNLSLGQVECIIASEHAPSTVWLAAAHLMDWLAMRAAGQRSYQVQKEIALVKRGPVQKGAVTNGDKEAENSCVLVED